MDDPTGNMLTRALYALTASVNDCVKLLKKVTEDFQAERIRRNSDFAYQCVVCGGWVDEPLIHGHAWDELTEEQKAMMGSGHCLFRAVGQGGG